MGASLPGCRCCANTRDRGGNADPYANVNDADLQAARDQDRLAGGRRAAPRNTPSSTANNSGTTTPVVASRRSSNRTSAYGDASVSKRSSIQSPVPVAADRASEQRSSVSPAPSESRRGSYRERRPSGILELFGATLSTPNPGAWTPPGSRGASPSPVQQQGSSGGKAPSYRERRSATATARKEILSEQASKQTDDGDGDSTPREEFPAPAGRQSRSSYAARREEQRELQNKLPVDTQVDNQESPTSGGGTPVGGQRSSYRARRAMQNAVSTTSVVASLQDGTGGSRSDRDRSNGEDDKRVVSQTNSGDDPETLSTPSTPKLEGRSSYAQKRRSRQADIGYNKEIDDVPASSAANSEVERDGSQGTRASVSYAERRAERLSKQRGGGEQRSSRSPAPGSSRQEEDDVNFGRRLSGVNLPAPGPAVMTDDNDELFEF